MAELSEDQKSLLKAVRETVNKTPPKLRLSEKWNWDKAQALGVDSVSVPSAKNGLSLEIFSTADELFNACKNEMGIACSTNYGTIAVIPPKLSTAISATAHDAKPKSFTLERFVGQYVFRRIARNAAEEISDFGCSLVHELAHENFASEYAANKADAECLAEVGRKESAPTSEEVLKMNLVAYGPEAYGSAIYEYLASIGKSRELLDWLPGRGKTKELADSVLAHLKDQEETAKNGGLKIEPELPELEATLRGFSEGSDEVMAAVIKGAKLQILGAATRDYAKENGVTLAEANRALLNLRVYLSGTKVRIEVKDEAIPVNPKLKEKIEERYERDFFSLIEEPD